MNKYEIWREGYKTTSENDTAHWFGIFHGDSFKEVCDRALGQTRYYNPETMTYWGCRLFDNEEDARKSFG